MGGCKRKGRSEGLGGDVVGAGASARCPRKMGRAAPATERIQARFRANTKSGDGEHQRKRRRSRMQRTRVRVFCEVVVVVVVVVAERGAEGGG